MHGQFSWYDLMTPDSAVAKKFYPAVTGWSTEEWDKADYTMWTARGAPFGGMNPITPEQTAQGIQPHWLAYVTVDDIGRTTERVRSLGGQVLHEEEIPDVGRFAIIQDPQGAILAAIKSSTPSPGWDGTPSLGKFSWHELMTSDYRAAFDFYRQLFGWENQQEMDMGPAGKYLMYGKNCKMFGGIYNREPERANVPPTWLFYANVKDVKKSIEAVKRNGGQLRMGPMQVPGGDWVAVFTDPQGAPFAVHQTTAKAAAAHKAQPKKKSSAKSKTKTKPKAKAKKKSKPKANPHAKARPKKAARKARRR
jgi:predicted enzyme related to lactoylglutathione lyase